jgi:hypothetical protein
VPLIILIIALCLILASRYVAARWILVTISLFGLLGLVADPGYVEQLRLRIAATLAVVIVIVFNVRGLIHSP